MSDSIRIAAPATVSNVGPGFDLMGFALEQPLDILKVKRNKQNTIRIFNESDATIPLDPFKNVSSVAIKSLLDTLQINEGFDLIFEKKINPGSGIGSSAASCTAAVYGVNQLLGKPMETESLIDSALAGEFIASGSLHADNIAPALLGGFILIRSYNPIDIIKLTYPKNLVCTLVHPDLVINTKESRKLIPEKIELNASIAQSGNIAALVAGLNTNNYALIGRSLIDKIAEPHRSKFIPGYDILRKRLSDCGVLGMNISGSGPSVFALSDNPETAAKAAKIMEDTFLENNIKSVTYVSGVSQVGTRVLD
ncbi:MAG: homoserine kinase [Bacteroidales bacterium]|nr:homoserine kinase [Bacteroidales bacterium]MCF8389721.1 homoserine kinase [Bacteroidales bacterium]